MNATLVIARRELAEKRFVFTAAVSLAIIVLLMPLVPGVPAGNGRGVIVVASAILGVGFALGLAAILGATIIGRELTEKRLSFYFSKPIPAASIWSGKLIAAVILIAGTFLIVSLPSFFAGREAIRQVWSDEGRNAIGIFAVVVAVFFFVGHILSTIARARSAWAFVDLLAIAALAFVSWLVIRPLLDAMAFEMMALVAKIAAWLLLIVAILAGAWQLSAGRTDRQRSHLAQMRFLWPGAAVVVAVAAAIVAWVVSADPQDLTGNINAYTAERSEYSIVMGDARNRKDYHPAFLLHVPTGKFERFGGMSPFFGAEFVAGGKKMLVLRPIDRKTGTSEVLIRDMAEGSREEPTGLTVSRWRGEIVTTADAQRLAYLSNDLVSVYDVAARRSLGSAKIPAGEYVRALWFASPDVLRIHTIAGGPSKTVSVPRAARVYEYDTRTRAFAKTGEHVHVSPRFVMTLVSPDRSKIIVRDADGNSVVSDSRTMAPLVTIPPVSRIVALTDGRYAGFDDKSATLRVFNAAGAEERAIALGAVAEQWGAREIAPGKLLVAGKEKVAPKADGWRVSLVDINSGAIVRSETGLRPMENSFWRREPVSPYQLFETPDRKLVSWNPITNEKKVVVQAN